MTVEKAIEYIIITIVMVGGMLLVTWRLWLWNKAVVAYQPDISDHPELTASEERRIKRAYIYARLFLPFMAGFFVQCGVLLVCQVVLGGIVKDESNTSRDLMNLFIVFSAVYLLGIVWTGIGAKVLTCGKRWKTVLAKIERKQQADVGEPQTPAAGTGRLLYSAGRLAGSKEAMAAGAMGAANEAGAAIAGVGDYLEKIGEAAGITLPNTEWALIGILVSPSVVYVLLTAVACVRLV